MPDLTEFLDALNEQSADVSGGTIADVVTDEGLRRRADSLRDVTRQRLERAGVTHEQLGSEVVEHLTLAVDTIAKRIRERAFVSGLYEGDMLETELMRLAGSTALQWFVAGTLWQQQVDLERMIGGDA